jgi:RHS repeat-associated protein
MTFGARRSAGKRARQWTRVAVAVLLLVFFAGATAAIAAQQPQPEEQSSGASQEGPPKELPGKRTATSDTFALPDGQREARIYQAPINYKTASGAWKPIEEGLEETAQGNLVNGEGPVDVTLPSELQDGSTRLDLGDSWVSAKLLGLGTEEAEVEHGSATYENPAKEVSFHYSTLPYGLKESIELEGPAAPATFHYQLSASAGLSAELTKEGSIAFSDADGQAVALIPAPFVTDASSPEPAPEAASYSLTPGSEGSWDLTLEVDRSWLESPERVRPVTVDPTLYGAELPGTADCDVTHWRSSLLETVGGICDRGLSWFPEAAESFEPEFPHWLYRALLSFNLGSLPAGADIREATMSLYAGEAAVSVNGVQARRVTTPWSPENPPNWVYAAPSEPGRRAWTTPGGDFTNEGSEILTSERGSQAGWWNFSKGVAPIVANWAHGTYPNYGFLFKLNDEGRECVPDGSGGCVYRRVGWAGPIYSEPSKRPYLKVLYWLKAPASSKIVSPKEGTTTAGRLNLKAAWTEAGVTGVTFQYRESKTGFFENIPPELVHKANGEALTKWPYAVSGEQETPPLYVNAAQLSTALRKEGGSVQVRPIFDGLGTGAEGYSAPVEAKVNRFLGGPKDATAQVGPGTVDLLTGNLTLGRTDVSIPGFISGLEFSRTFNTRGLGASGSAQETEENKSALGQGWKPSVPVEEAGGSEWRGVVLHKFSETIEGETFGFAWATLTSKEGYETSFEEEESTGAFITPPELSGWKLARESGGLVLSDPAGNRTTFSNLGSGSEYVPTAISQVGSSGPTTRVEYEFKEEKKRVKMVIAPTPAGVSCTTQAEAEAHAGCHALIFAYAPATTWGAPAADGERLSKITYYAPGNGGPWEVSNYKYDANGRLVEEWDPRISPALPEKYAYNSAGQLTMLTPAGQKPWELEYATFEEEAGGGRLIAAKRDSLVAGTAKTTVAYGVPVSGSGAAYEMGGATVAQWGQTDVPVSATAIFPPSEEPSKPPSAYTRASVYYMDSEGYGVNTATPKGGGTSEPSISTSESDEYGNVVRELTPANRLRVLAEPEGKAREERWKALETKRHYNEAGTQMVEEWGPLHQVRLSSGTVTEARFHKVVQYENPENLSPNPHLPVRETTGASIPGEGIDADQRVTEYKYRWSLRKPIETIVDPGTGHLNIKSVVAYDETTGLPIETRQPNHSGESSSPGTTKTIYYTAGAGFPGCENAAYAGRVCETLPGAQTSGTGRLELLVKKVLAYNAFGEPTEVSESPGGGSSGLRKTTIVYDKAGRQLTQKIEGGGEVVPKTETVYSPTLGLPEKQQFVCEGAECGEGGFSYQRSFGTSGPGNGQFAHPAGIAIDASGNLWVADQNNHRLEEFNAKGEFLKAIGSSGSGNGQFGRPTDVAIDAKGNIWATDASNNRIEEFNEAGEFLKAIGSAGTGNLQFSGPECIAIDPKGNIWVGDTYNHRLQELNEKGEFIRTVGSNGSGEGQMVEPTGIAIGPGGNVWVADWGDQRVEEFSETGAFIRQFGSEGSGNGQFKRPDVIEVEANGNVFVGDQNNERFQEFNQKGEFVAKFGTAGTGAGQFSFGWPMGIAADGKGNLWISDTGNNRVQKWALTTPFDNQATRTSYDALGRPVEYEDADGNVSNVTYDLEGRPLTKTDAKGSQTYHYDSVTGLLTELTDSGAGTFTAKYDADGNLIERTLPNGLTARTTYNQVDEPTHLTYTKASNCGTSCTWYDEGLERSIYGQILNKPASLSNEQYSYDKAGRLTLAEETPTGGTCTTRSYKYDTDSNREEVVSRGAGIGGACNTESGGSAQKYKYDAADRLEGPTYDAWGRIESLPAEFAGGKMLTTHYFADEMVATQSQGGITNTFQLDAMGRQRQRLQAGGLEGVEVFHYDGAGSSLAWTERAGTWIRSVVGIGGELCATQESGTGVVVLLTDLHGSVVATASPNPAETKLISTYQYDEFGNPVSGAAGRFGWLGGKQRRTELPSGVIQMGARSYVPQIGRFLSLDPVPGGSANAYDYVNQDPVNGFDLAGTKPYDESQIGEGNCHGDLHVYSFGHRFHAKFKVNCNVSGYTISVLKVQKVFWRHTDNGLSLPGRSFEPIVASEHKPSNASGSHWQHEWGNWNTKRGTVFNCTPGTEYQYTIDVVIRWHIGGTIAAGDGESPPGGIGEEGGGTLSLQAQEVCGKGGP